MIQDGRRTIYFRFAPYLLYIDSAGDGAIDSPEVKKSLGRVVGRINDHPDVARGRVLMMGPIRRVSSGMLSRIIERRRNH